MDFTGKSPYSVRQYGKFPTAFNPNEIVIPRMDYTNKGGVVDNNLGVDLHNESVVENLLVISSSDRNTTKYPDPFKFDVILGGASSSTESTISPSGVYTTTTYSGAPDPKIQTDFKNVKYIRIDDVILPDTNVVLIDADPPADQYTMSTADDDLFEKQRGIVLRIEEIANNRIWTTGTLKSYDTILYIDYEMGLDHKYWKPTHGLRTYPTSKLINLRKLSIRLLNDEGEEIQVLGKSLGPPITYTSFNIPATLATLNPDLFPVQYANLVRTNRQMQSIYEIMVGVIDNELNTLVKFR